MTLRKGAIVFVCTCIAILAGIHFWGPQHKDSIGYRVSIFGVRLPLTEQEKVLREAQNMTKKYEDYLYERNDKEQDLFSYPGGKEHLKTLNQCKWVNYTAKSGDTLESIAKTLCPEMSQEGVIWEIKKQSGITQTVKTIKPGDYLALPATKNISKVVKK